MFLLTFGLTLTQTALTYQPRLFICSTTRVPVQRPIATNRTAPAAIPSGGKSSLTLPVTISKPPTVALNFVPSNPSIYALMGVEKGSEAV
jgi:hypothetical protein